ncbi:MAG: putative phage-associated protein [Candidatus Deianiraeaceae bacterium]|jgi:uncharacterized phage-associated protein
MPQAKYTPQQVANYFIEQARRQGVELTKIKLMKLVYISYAWYLYFTDQDLFDEKIEAWEYGPVIPAIRDKINENIEGNIIQDYIDGEDTKIPKEDFQTDEFLRITVNCIWDLYKNTTPFKLVGILHEEGSAWKAVYEKNKNNPINTEKNKKLIKKRAEIAINKIINN